MATNNSIQELWSAIGVVRKGLEQLERAMVEIMQDAALGQTVRAAIANPLALPKPSSAPAEDKTARPARQVAKAKRGRPGRRAFGAAGAKAADDIVAALKEQHNGLSLKELSAATGLSAEAVSYRLGVLRRENRVRMEGQKSSARYFLPA